MASVDLMTSFRIFPNPPPLLPSRQVACKRLCRRSNMRMKRRKGFLVASRCVKVGSFISTLRHVMHSNRMRDIVLNSKIVTHELKRKGGTSKFLRRWGRKSQLRLKERYMSDLWKDDIPQSQRHQACAIPRLVFSSFLYSIDDSKWPVFRIHESL